MHRSGSVGVAGSSYSLNVLFGISLIFIVYRITNHDYRTTRLKKMHTCSKLGKTLNLQDEYIKYKPPTTTKPPHKKSLNQAILSVNRLQWLAHRLFEASAGTWPIYSITHLAPDQSQKRTHRPSRAPVPASSLSGTRSLHGAAHTHLYIEHSLTGGGKSW